MFFDALKVYSCAVVFVWVYVLLKVATKIYKEWLLLEACPTGAMDSALDF